MFSCLRQLEFEFEAERNRIFPEMSVATDNYHIELKS